MHFLNDYDNLGPPPKGKVKSGLERRRNPRVKRQWIDHTQTN